MSEYISPEEAEALARDNKERAIVEAKPAARKSTGSYLPDIHRLLPQSGDAEQGVLSSIMLSPREVINLCLEKGITVEHFHIPAHLELFRAAMRMFEEGTPIDVITLTEYLRDRKLIDQVGGPAFVTDIFTFLPTAANAEYYIGIIEEKYTLREIIRVCTEYAARSYDEQGEVTNLLDEVEQRILKISRDRYTDTQTGSMKDDVMAAIHAIEEMYSNRGTVNGMATGFRDLDIILDGLKKQEMFVIAARPSMGKTALAMAIAEYVAIESKLAVGVFSLEMSKSQLVQRLLCSRARVDLTRLRQGHLEEADFPALTSSASKLAECRMFIDDSSDLTIQTLRARARRWVALHGVKVIFVDYLQLVKSSTRKAQESRQVEVTEVSNGLKAMAKELDIPVVVLAQLKRRDPMKGETKRPRLDDLRESGAIEQDADTVGLLYREEYYAESAEARREVEGQADLIIAKQRNGPVGEVPLTFLKQFTRFETRCFEQEESAQGALTFES